MGALQSAAGFAMFSYMIDYLGVGGGGGGGGGEDAAHAAAPPAGAQVRLGRDVPVFDVRSWLDLPSRLLWLPFCVARQAAHQSVLRTRLSVQMYNSWLKVPCHRHEAHCSKAMLHAVEL